MNLYLTYDESVRTVQDDPEEDWREEEVTFLPRALHRSLPGAGAGDFSELTCVDPGAADLTAAYLVVARYYDGSTFDRTLGLWQPLGVCVSAAAASALEDLVRTGAYSGPGRYAPWLHYFAGLEDTEIHHLEVHP